MTNPMNNQPWQQPAAPQPVQSQTSQYPQSQQPAPPTMQQPQFQQPPMQTPQERMAKSLSHYKIATIILAVAAGLLFLLSFFLFIVIGTTADSGSSTGTDSADTRTELSDAFDDCNDDDVLELHNNGKTLAMDADVDDASDPYQCLVGDLNIPSAIQDKIEGDSDSGSATFDGISLNWRFTDDDELQMVFKYKE